MYRLLRFRFTLSTLFLLIAAALLMRYPVPDLPRGWRRRLGFAPRDLASLRWERLLTSALVTSGGRVFWGALALVSLCVGAAEWLVGTRRAALSFWGIHFATLILESAIVAYPLHWAQFGLASALYIVRDIGPSAGYFGCMGLVCRRLPQPWRWISGGSILVFLIASLFVRPTGTTKASAKLAADIAHAIAFPLGWILAGWYDESTHRPPPLRWRASS